MHGLKATIILSIITMTSLPLTACDSSSPSDSSSNSASSQLSPPPSQPSDSPETVFSSPLPTVPTTPITAPIPETSGATTHQKLVGQKTLASGTFASGEHLTKGIVTVVDDEGVPIIQFSEAFQTNEGPELFVVLHVDQDVLASTVPPTHPLEQGDYVAIAPLKATQGSQNYSLPAAIILDNYQSVAIWCRQFNTTFGAAPIQPVNP